MTCDQEFVKPKPRLKGAIDRYLSGGSFPTNEEFLEDSTLALYHRLTGCRFLWIIPGFASSDVAAGGIRVIVYGQLAHWEPPSSFQSSLSDSHLSPATASSFH